MSPSFFLILAMAVGLSLDAFAVAMASGSVIPRVRKRDAFKIAIFFGGFQAIMPLIGWLAGIGIRTYISNLDHWIAFILLAAVGIKMIHESFMVKKANTNNPLAIPVLLLLSVATSIDAFAVGVTLSLLHAGIIVTILIIGATTFILTFLGVFAGNRARVLLESRMELASGIILMLIGFKILADHLFVR